MVIPNWALFSEAEKRVLSATMAFLDGRLDERSSIEWALQLGERESVKRAALVSLLDTPAGRKLSEPWRTAWRFIEESWEGPLDRQQASHITYDVKSRLKSGERSGSLITQIVQLVRPAVKAAPFSKIDLLHRKVPRRPRRVEDLLSIGLTSGEVLDPSEIGLDRVTEQPFLGELADELDAAVSRGLNIGRRIDWDGENGLWRLGEVHRVYFVPVRARRDGEHEPDEFNHGIAASVKLLHATVALLRDVAFEKAAVYIRRWRETPTPIHSRLWAAFARDPRIASPAQVADFLLSADDRRFWNLHAYPEIAELRACRFVEMGDDDQKAVVARLRKGPPRNHWPKDADEERVAGAQVYWIARELRRIEIAGGNLSREQRDWLAARLAESSTLAEMTRLDEGFLGTTKAHFVSPDPDDRFDSLEGIQRLNALEAALSSNRRAWDDDPAERASDWVRKSGSVEKILSDFEVGAQAGIDFPRVWDRFGWAHSPKEADGDERSKRDLGATAARVLALIERLPEGTLRQAIEGLTFWFSAWGKHIAGTPAALSAWLRLWPIAVAVTNSQQAPDEEPDLNVVVQSSTSEGSQDLDTLNTPAGRLVGAFLAACPQVRKGNRPFDRADLRAMREAAVSASGRAGLIARHRMIEDLSWFFIADPEWSKAELIAPLREATQDALILWRAVARRVHSTEVLKLIGELMTARAIDPRLRRETRQALVFSLVVEALHALREKRPPAVPHAQVQQMLRSLDDEVRAHAAEVVRRFVSGMSSERERGGAPASPEALFRGAAGPFLQNVWPQERSLTTRGVARGFADLPAVCGEAFAEAVNAIERFLVPFDCWSLSDYGLYGDEELSKIDGEPKAEALLRLLDATIGTVEGAVFPMDLGEALEQVRKAGPRLVEAPNFRRLATLTRR